jgi:pimeloyl-ACP methyl ester carboxylesterase
MPYAENNGTKIYWQEEGIGGTAGAGDPGASAIDARATVLLIMGLGYTHEMWSRVAPVLGSKYRVISFDNRGVGLTDAPPGPYTMPAMAADSIAVMDAAGCRQAHVFGISMGGMIAQELVLRYPERVRSLILGCTACGGAHSVPARPQVLETLRARGTMSVDEGIRAMVPYIYDQATPRERIEQDLEIRARTYPRPESYFAQLAGVMAHDTYERLGSIAVPTLVIHGEGDMLVPPENGRLLASRIPGAKLVMLPSASHIFPTDQPEASITAILSFLSEV